MADNMFQNSPIPKGSWILVTGVNGFLASHIADQLLRNGYKVRGSVRTPSKTKWVKDRFEQKYGHFMFELVQVEDATLPGAFETPMKGVAGVAHVASIFGGAQDLISKVIKMNRNLLTTASQESTVKRFVYTSSSEAAIYSSFLEHEQHKKTHVTVDTWNEDTIQRVSRMVPMTPKAGFDIYAASKTLGERAIWEWVKEFKPQFMVNTVLPSVCFGRPVDHEKQGHASSSGWPAAIFQDKFDTVWPFLQHIIPIGAYGVDAEDIALLHVAGLVHRDVQSERLLAFGNPFTWKEVTEIFQKNFPDREFTQDTSILVHQAGTLDVDPTNRAEGLLRTMGKPGFSSLEQTLMKNVEDIA